MAEHYWRNGKATVAGIVAFTEGDCWILAIHIHKMTGHPIYLIDDGNHWVVRQAGYDRYIDVTGVWSRSQLLWRWHAKSLRRASEFMLNSALSDTHRGGPEDFEGSQRRAPLMARRLLEVYT